jgi:drug/metabolite transporter (DMT)-like permease
MRGLALVVITFILARVYDIGLEFKSPFNFKYLCIRSLFIFAHGIGFSGVQFYLPLPIVHTINSSGPLFIFIMDYFMNGVKINNKQLMGIIIAVLGVAITVNGESVMEFMDDDY